MRKILLAAALLVIQATFAQAQLSLSKVNTGDCVASRISAKRTTFVAELDKKYCAEHNTDEAGKRKCIENSGRQEEFSFFTDRCSDEDYFIGINGKEVRLKRISKKPGKPTAFIGSFAGEGVRVEISRPRLLGKITYDSDGSGEKEVLDASYKVLVTVKKGALKKSFKGILWYGR